MTTSPRGSYAENTSAPGERSLTDLLTRRTARGLLLQELSPITESIPWLRSQRYWTQAGLEVFTSGEVPYIVTNDGEQSRKAMEVYVASLRATESELCSEEPSYVLEFGTGTGLFAKLFLDQLRARSLAEGTRDYERTTYIVADHSLGLLDDTRTSGVFADHEERVLRLHLASGGLRAPLLGILPEAVGSIRAIHANYVLDSLPFTILSSSDRGLFELRIRTRLSEDVLRPGTQPPSTSDVRLLEPWVADIIGIDSEPAHSALLFESEYVRVARDALPFPELIPPSAVQAGSQASLQFVHSFGAVECLDDVLGILRPDGYFIAMDYGCDGSRPEPIEFQTFGSSVAAGVNFSQLVDHARARRDCVVGVPAADPTSLQARLFARERAPVEVIQLFQTLYSKEAAERTEAPYREALELARNGQYEAARWKFDQAYLLQPWNWHLMEAIVAFLSYTLEEHATGLEIAKRALQLNHLSPRLWNLLGDCYYGSGTLDSAEQAYRQATRVDPGDVRGRTNLAYVFLKRGAPDEALRIIGEALALDRSGECRDELLSKQAEALQSLTAEQVRQMRGRLSRLSGHHALPGRSAT